MPDANDPLVPIFRRMGEPSWLILRVLEPANAIPGIEIIRRVEGVLAGADYPQRRLDPSTLHYAIKRMIEDGLVDERGRKDVDVPGPRGTTRCEPRTVYVITGLGATVLERRRRFETALHAGTARDGGRPWEPQRPAAQGAY